MDSRTRKKVFLAALEVLELSRHATACGMTRKFDELADFVAKGGKVTKGGALFVSAARGSNHSWLDWAADFFSCLPQSAEDKKKIVAAYTVEDGIDKGSKGARRGFWKRVKARGLDKAGLVIARAM